MTHEDLVSQLRNIERSHRGDGDGGYAAVASIRAFWRELGPASRRDMKEVLGNLVATKEPSLWSLSWEALVQEEAVDIAPQIFELLQARKSDTDWADDIVMGLIRLRYRDQTNYLCDYIRARLQDVGPLVLPLVAALVRVSVGDSLSIASHFIGEPHRPDMLERIEKYAPSFVRNYLLIDDSLLSRLIVAIGERNRATARSFARAVEGYLRQPWMLKELGEARSSRICSEVAAAGGAIN